MICKKPDGCKIILFLAFLIAFELLYINYPKDLVRPIYLDFYNFNYISTQKIYRDLLHNKTTRISHDPLIYQHNFSSLLKKLDIFETKPNFTNLSNFQYLLYNKSQSKNIDVLQLIIIQLHNRPQNIKALVTSLQDSQFITNSLIIFSSDCYSPAIIKILQNIKFAAYAHIQYPLSQEVFLDSFKQKVVNFVDAHRHTFFPPANGATPRAVKITDRAKTLLKEWITACESYEPIAFNRLQTFISSTHHPIEVVRTLPNGTVTGSAKFGLNLIKHHWWWKLNAVFGSGPFALTLAVPKSGYNGNESSSAFYSYRTADYRGPVLFLEEDYYLLPDAFYVLNKAWARLNPGLNRSTWSAVGTSPPLNYAELFRGNHKFEGPVKLLSLGNYETLIPAQMKDDKKVFVDKFTSTTSGALLNRAQWRSAFHNMGMVWDRRLWLLTFGASGDDGLWARTFCNYDDYNWDWTVNRLFRTLIGFPVYAVFPVLPRVVHIGVCGVHQKITSTPSVGIVQSRCSPASMVDNLKAWTAVKKAKGILFPTQLKFLQPHRYLDFGPVNPNGGWASQLDHELCLNASARVGGLRV